jgi:hypothetical protein
VIEEKLTKLKGRNIAESKSHVEYCPWRDLILAVEVVRSSKVDELSLGDLILAADACGREEGMHDGYEWKVKRQERSNIPNTRLRILT